MILRKESRELQRQLGAARGRLLRKLQKLRETADLFDGPSAVPPSVQRDQEEAVSKAFRHVLRLGEGSVPRRARRVEWARGIILEWLQSLSNSKEILPLLLRKLESEVDEEIAPETDRLLSPQTQKRSAASSKTQPAKRPHTRKYRSLLKRRIRTILTDNPEALTPEVCTAVDEEGLPERALPPSLRKAGYRSLEVAYKKDASIRRNLRSEVNKVRTDLGIARPHEA